MGASTTPGWKVLLAIENPAGSYAWAFDNILQKLLKDGEGKFILGDQCPYGKWDYKIGRPVQKKTGWLSNSEVILSHMWGSLAPPCLGAGERGQVE